MTSITTFVKHDDLIVNVETRGPISGTEDRYVTKIYFGDLVDSPVSVDFFHTGKDVNILHLLKDKVSGEKTVILDTRLESFTLP